MRDTYLLRSCGAWGIVGDPFSLLIVEDDAGIALSLRAGLCAQSAVSDVHAVGTVAQAIDALFDRRPRLVLVDLGLPDGSGVEVIEAVQTTDWECDCVVLSIFGDEERVIEAIRKGARGYLLKTDKARDIVADLQSVLEGGSPISAKVARYILARMPAQDEATEAVASPLTQRERHILTRVARGYKRQEIAEDLEISLATVSTHINNVYRKLDATSNITAVSTATRLGFI